MAADVTLTHCWCCTLRCLQERQEVLQELFKAREVERSPQAKALRSGQPVEVPHL